MVPAGANLAIPQLVKGSLYVCRIYTAVAGVDKTQAVINRMRRGFFTCFVSFNGQAFCVQLNMAKGVKVED